MADLLLESGLVSANFGIETLTHEAGKAIGKGLHPDKTRELLHWLRDEKWGRDILTFSGFIVGLPHETPDTVRQWTGEILDESFPLDGFRLTPLIINRHAKRFHLSEFELNHQDYGYRFPDPADPLYWENDAFNSRSAIATVTDVMVLGDRTRRNRVGGFNAPMFENLGYRWDDIKTMRTGDERFDELLRRRIGMAASYFERLLDVETPSGAVSAASRRATYMSSATADS
jgi:hypothetical protein